MPDDRGSRPPLRQVLRTAGELLRASWRDLLLASLAWQLLTFALLSPAVALLTRLLFALDGRRTVANADLLAFALSPIGLASLLILGAAAATIAIGGATALFAVTVAARHGRRLLWWQALLLVGRRRRQMAGLAATLVMRAARAALPFLAALGAIFLLLLGEHDINYYLTAKPPAFWTALVLAGLVASGLGLVLGGLLARWSLALPLVLLEDTLATDALARSRAIVDRNGRWRTLLVIAGGPLLAGLLLVVGSAALALLGDLALAAATGHLRTTAVLLGVVIASETLLATTLTLLGNGAAVSLATAVFTASAPGEFPAAPEAPSQPPFALLKTPRLRSLALLGLPVVAAVFTAGLLADLQTPDRVLCIAHRAGGLLGPENSLQALRASIEAGADRAEIDVQRAADGVVMVAHDRDLMKAAGLPWRIAETPSARLRAPREDGGGGLPTLLEFCTTAGDAIDLCVELKYYGADPELAPATLEVLRQTGHLARCEVLSLNEAALRQVRGLAPEVRLGFLSSVALGKLTRLDVEVLAVAAPAATTVLIGDAARHRKAVYAWTLNDAQSISRALDRGVDGIITDDPRLVTQVLADRAELTDIERMLLRFAALQNR